MSKLNNVTVVTTKNATILRDDDVECDWCMGWCDCPACSGRCDCEEDDCICFARCDGECTCKRPNHVQELRGNLDVIQLDLDLDGNEFAESFYVKTHPLPERSEAKMLIDHEGAWTEVTYSFPEGADIDPKVLIDYTLGQMADGIGEGYEQFPVAIFGINGYFVSMWTEGMEAKVTR